MKRYFVPNILSEVEFEDLKKKSETGDAVAQLQLSLAVIRNLGNWQKLCTLEIISSIQKNNRKN